MNYLDYVIYNMQAPSTKPQEVKVQVLISPLDNPSCSIRYNTCNLLPPPPHCPQAGHGEQGAARLE